jgi:hypothetical protein
VGKRQLFRHGEMSPLKDHDMLAQKILETIEEMERDEKWDATLMAPEADAYCAKREKEIMEENLTDRTKE